MPFAGSPHQKAPLWKLSPPPPQTGAWACQLYLQQGGHHKQTWSSESYSVSSIYRVSKHC